MTHLPLQGDRSMWRNILKYGVIAGLVVADGMWGTLLAFGGDMPHGWFGMALGYLSMLVAHSAAFVGIKHHRDVDRGDRTSTRLNSSPYCATRKTSSA